MNFAGCYHRYRRPRLLTRLKRRATVHKKNDVFCILRPPLFPIPLNHLFCGRTNWCESFGCIFVLISTIYNLKFNRARMGKTKSARNCQPGFFACVFLQPFTSFSQVTWYISNYSKSYYCLFCSFIAISTKIQYFHLKILGHSILKNLFFIEKNALNLGLNCVLSITARLDVGI